MKSLSSMKMMLYDIFFYLQKLTSSFFSVVWGMCVLRAHKGETASGIFSHTKLYLEKYLWHFWSLIWWRCLWINNEVIFLNTNIKTEPYGQTSRETAGGKRHQRLIWMSLSKAACEGVVDAAVKKKGGGVRMVWRKCDETSSRCLCCCWVAPGCRRCVSHSKPGRINSGPSPSLVTVIRPAQRRRGAGRSRRGQI